jgi:hypothetical protein
MKGVLIIGLTVACTLMTVAQAKIDSADLGKLHGPIPEIFTSGFIDIMNNGQVNASARFIRLNIGEPGKFCIPLSLYGGVSNNTFQSPQLGGFSQHNNEQLINQYINPLSGLINVSVEGIRFFSRSKKLTQTGLLYQAGERVLTGYRSSNPGDPQAGRPSNFLNSFAVAGVYFQTGAWERNNASNIGLFWISCRYIVSKSSSSNIREFLPEINTNGFYHGYSMGLGVEINNLVNIKAIFYRYVKKPEIEYYLPIYQFTFNYSMKH